MPLINDQNLLLIAQQAREHLDLRNQGLIDEQIPVLCDAIKKNNCIVSLDVSRNSLFSDSAEILAELSQLKKLNIRENYLGDEGFFFLSKAKHLEYLDISSNGITDVGAQGFLDNSQLKTLIYSKNPQISNSMKQKIDEHISLVNGEQPGDKIKFYLKTNLPNFTYKRLEKRTPKNSINFFRSQEKQTESTNILDSNVDDFYKNSLESLSPDKQRNILYRLAKRCDIDVSELLEISDNKRI